MITTKQRAYLRGLANTYDTIIQIGKGGVTENTVKQMREALAARELVKARCLESAMLSPRETAQDLARKCGADIVQVIGTRFILYRPAKEPKIVLPQ